MAASLLTPLVTNSWANGLFCAFEATMKACAPMNGSAGCSPAKPGTGWMAYSMPLFLTSGSAHGPETRNAALPLVKRAIELSGLIEVRSTFCLPSSEIVSAASSEPGLPTPRSVGSYPPSAVWPNR